MFKTILKNKLKKEVKNESSKIFLYTLVGGVTSIFLYKKFSCKNESKYLNFYKGIEKNNLENKDYKELKSKINEFNSRRINDKNNSDASINEMKNIINKTLSSKKDVDIEVFSNDKFEEYQEEMDKKI